MESIQEKLVVALQTKKMVLATAESCTGGLVSEKITEVAGCSAVFTCGVCSYANEIKECVLGVKHETLLRYGAVSEETAREMAAGIRRISGASVGISTTGIAGPGGGTTEKPVGLVYIAVDSDGYRATRRLLLDPEQNKTRQQIREAAAQEVLALALQAVEAAEK